ncbi:MAG TPA: cupin domain-containing protein [Acidimicrobiales bacterium]|nr:cupin domain-containing protein [Acidimicrobiales bacterium]
MSGKAVVKDLGKGQAVWMLGGLYEVLVSADETSGKTTVMHFTIPVGAAPPLHCHDGDETVYLLEGTLHYHIGGETFEGGPGSIFYIPAGTEENFEPTSTVKLLVKYEPGGIDKFFTEAGEPATAREVPPAPTAPPDIAGLVEIGARHGLRLIPPA